MEVRNIEDGVPYPSHHAYTGHGMQLMQQRVADTFMLLSFAGRIQQIQPPLPSVSQI